MALDVIVSVQRVSTLPVLGLILVVDQRYLLVRDGKKDYWGDENLTYWKKGLVTDGFLEALGKKHFKTSW